MGKFIFRLFSAICLLVGALVVVDYFLKNKKQDYVTIYDDEEGLY